MSSEPQGRFDQIISHKVVSSIEESNPSSIEKEITCFFETSCGELLFIKEQIPESVERSSVDIEMNSQASSGCQADETTASSGISAEEKQEIEVRTLNFTNVEESVGVDEDEKLVKESQEISSQGFISDIKQEQFCNNVEENFVTFFDIIAKQQKIFQELDYVDENAKIDCSADMEKQDTVDCSQISEKGTVCLFESKDDSTVMEPEAKAIEIQEMVQGEGTEMGSFKEGVENCLQFDAELYLDPVLQTGTDSVEEEVVTEIGEKLSVNSSEILKQEVVGESEKCFERNVKGKVSEMNGSEHSYQKKKNGSKRHYVRNEMESLRFLNVEEQKKMWTEIYLMMGPTVTQEYEEITSTKPQKPCTKNADRQRLAKKKENDPILSITKKKENGPILGIKKKKDNGPILSITKKKVGGPLLGLVASKGHGNHLQIFVL